MEYHFTILLYFVRIYGYIQWIVEKVGKMSVKHILQFFLTYVDNSEMRLHPAYMLQIRRNAHPEFQG